MSIAPFLLRALPLVAYSFVGVAMAVIGYLGIFLISHFDVSSDGWSVILCLSTFLISASTGFLYSFIVGSMLQIYPDRSTLVLTSTNLAYGVGGIVITMIYAYSSLSVENFVLFLVVLHASVGRSSKCEKFLTIFQ